MSSATGAGPAAASAAAPSSAWFTPTAEQARRFGAHLQRQLEPRHVLYGRTVTPIAARAGGDDVVFALGGGAVALVHLTYARRPAAAIEWPPATIFPSLEQAIAAAGR
jgi:hypothetical protein